MTVVLPSAILTALVGSSAAATAHAWLDTSEPGYGARVLDSPDEVVLRFSEGIDPEGSGADVLNESELPVNAGPIEFHPGGRPNELSVPLASPPNGSYVVRWWTQSAMDSHLAQGSFPFFVGAATPTPSDEYIPGPLPSSLLAILAGLSVALRRRRA